MSEMISSPVTMSCDAGNQSLGAQVANSLGSLPCWQAGLHCGEATNLVDNHGESF